MRSWTIDLATVLELATHIIQKVRVDDLWELSRS